mmetsp:Transcript_31658/g.60443  ORF Transcript_31658/g.60443 Transcript_31658/m.60443 type:complete len:321 (+) Transcript_31658:1347-2309(+)
MDVSVVGIGRCLLWKIDDDALRVSSGEGGASFIGMLFREDGLFGGGDSAVSRAMGLIGGDVRDAGGIMFVIADGSAFAVEDVLFARGRFVSGSESLSITMISVIEPPCAAFSFCGTLFCGTFSFLFAGLSDAGDLGGENFVIFDAVVFAIEHVLFAAGPFGSGSSSESLLITMTFAIEPALDALSPIRASTRQEFSSSFCGAVFSGAFLFILFGLVGVLGSFSARPSNVRQGRFFSADEFVLTVAVALLLFMVLSSSTLLVRLIESREGCSPPPPRMSIASSALHVVPVASFVFISDVSPCGCVPDDDEDHRSKLNPLCP